MSDVPDGGSASRSNLTISRQELNVIIVIDRRVGNGTIGPTAFGARFNVSTHEITSPNWLLVHTSGVGNRMIVRTSWVFGES